MVGIAGNSSQQWGNKFLVFLTDSDNLNNTTNGVTVLQAFKCSLANVVAFAAILGRGGPL